MKKSQIFRRVQTVIFGMMLWAVTFMSVIPTGLAIARHEHVSIRAVAEAEEKAAAQAE